MSVTKLSIVVPAYNEGNTLPQLVAELERVQFGTIEPEIIIVNDGSNDETVHIFATLPPHIKTVSHQTNQGKSAAIRTGLQLATGSHIIIQDADLEYDPHEIPILCSVVTERNVKVVYGKRTGSGSTPGRVDYFLGGKLVTLVCNALYFKQLADEPTCYKLIERELIESLNLREDRFDFCPEVTAKIFRLGHTIAEHPISYRPRSIDEGKKIRYYDGLRAIYVLMKYRLYPVHTWHKKTY